MESKRASANQRFSYLVTETKSYATIDAVGDNQNALINNHSEAVRHKVITKY